MLILIRVLLFSVQVDAEEGLDLQLDALLDTRMSDLFSVSVASDVRLGDDHAPVESHGRRRR